MANRRFPKPWSVREVAEAFVVEDASGFAICYVYFQVGERLVGTGADRRMDKAQALVIARKIAGLGQ